MNEVTMNKDIINDYLSNNLLFSKKSSNYNNWGRLIINAIDNDKPDELSDVYLKYKSLGCNVNHQVTLYGFNNYLWTANIHLFLGDTALHLCIKGKKMLCIYMLLLLEARIDIKNKLDLTAEDLSVNILNTSLVTLKKSAYEVLHNAIDPRIFKKHLPDSTIYRNLDIEAKCLFNDSRLLYTSIPDSVINKALQSVGNSTNISKQNNESKSNFIPQSNWQRRYYYNDSNKDIDKEAVHIYNRYINNKSKNKVKSNIQNNNNKNVKTKDFEDDHFFTTYLINRLTGEKKQLTEKQIKFGYWDKIIDTNTNTVYYINELTQKWQLNRPKDYEETKARNKIKKIDNEIGDKYDTNTVVEDISDNNYDVHNSQNVTIKSRNNETAIMKPREVIKPLTLTAEEEIEKFEFWLNNEKIDKQIVKQLNKNNNNESDALNIQLIDMQSNKKKLNIYLSNGADLRQFWSYSIGNIYDLIDILDKQKDKSKYIDDLKTFNKSKLTLISHLDSSIRSVNTRLPIDSSLLVPKEKGNQIDSKYPGKRYPWDPITKQLVIRNKEIDKIDNQNNPNDIIEKDKETPMIQHSEDNQIDSSVVASQLDNHEDSQIRSQIISQVDSNPSISKHESVNNKLHIDINTSEINIIDDNMDNELEKLVLDKEQTILSPKSKSDIAKEKLLNEMKQRIVIEQLEIQSNKTSDINNPTTYPSEYITRFLSKNAKIHPIANDGKSFDSKIGSRIDVLTEIQMNRPINNLSFLKLNTIDKSIEKKLGSKINNDKKINNDTTIYDDPLIYLPIKAISSFTNLKYLYLRKDSSSVSFFHSLSYNPNIKYINLSNKRIDSYIFSYLCICLTTLPNVTYVNCSGNCLTDSDINIFLRYYKNIKSIEKLILTGNRITSKGACKLMDGILSSDNKINYVKYTHLTNYICILIALLTSLSCNHIDADDMVLLSEKVNNFNASIYTSNRELNNITDGENSIYINDSRIDNVDTCIDRYWQVMFGDQGYFPHAFDNIYLLSNTTKSNNSEKMETSNDKTIQSKRLIL